MREMTWRLCVGLLAACSVAQAGTNGLDASFGSGGIALLGETPSSSLTISFLHAIATDKQDRILLGGIFHDASDPNNQRDLAAVGRLHTSGSWDVTFGDHGVYILPYGAPVAPYGGSIDNIAALADGSILLSGTSFLDSQIGRLGPFNSCILLLKLTAGGEPDTSFAPDHGGGECFDFAPPGDTQWLRHPNAIAARADGTFYATTFDTNLYDGSATLLGAVANFDAFGSLDPAFGTNGIVQSPLSFLQLNLTTNGELLGVEAAMRVGATLFDQLGALDVSYGTSGLAVFDPQQGEYGSQPGAARLDSQQRLVAGVTFFNAGTGYSYGLVRLDALGQPDATFNGSNQQPGSPAVAVPNVSGDGDNDFLVDVQPLADGHILVLGDSGSAAPGDGVSNIALLRLNPDSSYDTSFGDAAHPGWSSINIGGAAGSIAHARAVSPDSSGGAVAGISVFTDANGHGCSGVMRVIPDRLFDGVFDAPPAMPTCPQ